MKTVIGDMFQNIQGDIASISTSDFNGKTLYYYVVLYHTNNGDIIPMKLKTEQPDKSLIGKSVSFDCVVYSVKGKLYRNVKEVKVLEQ